MIEPRCLIARDARPPLFPECFADYLKMVSRKAGRDPLNWYDDNADNRARTKALSRGLTLDGNPYRQQRKRFRTRHLLRRP